VKWIPQATWGYSFQLNPGSATTTTVRIDVTLATGAVERWNISYPFPPTGQLLTCVVGSMADPEARTAPRRPCRLRTLGLA